MDVVTVSRKNKWSLPNDKLNIEKAEKECQRLKGLDWVRAQPFRGPLERFQWRVRTPCTNFASFYRHDS
jgi:hypothetical protein